MTTSKWPAKSAEIAFHKKKHATKSQVSISSLLEMWPGASCLADFHLLKIAFIGIWALFSWWILSYS